MARSYDVIKAAVDAAHPTPELTWLLDLDNPGHLHDDLSAAQAETTFDGVPYTFEAHVLGTDADLSWHGVMVVEETSRRVPATPGTYETWAAFKPAMQTAFNGVVEQVRQRMAVEIRASEELDDDGIVTSPDVDPVRLSGLTLGAAADLNMMIAPVFAPQTFRYQAYTAIPEVTLTAEAPDGAVVRWTHGRGGATGPMVSVGLLQGENVIACTVAQAGHIPTTYYVTIRHPRQ